MCGSCGGKKSAAKKVGVARPTTRQTYSTTGTSTYGKPRIKFGTRSR